MDSHATILVTGAAGFIGSCMASFLNQQGVKQLYLMDAFVREDKKRNYEHLDYLELIDREDIDLFTQRDLPIDWVIHFGAKTDTTEMRYEIHEHLNLEFSKKIWHYCSERSIPLMYASSAATYGNGELGYADTHAIVEQLHPLNPYGVSKNEFDKWALKQTISPPHWYGLKFFNVFGPNEYHKGRMASVVLHAFHQINTNGRLRLFKSHHPDFTDGGQKRDFIYVKDVLKMADWLMHHLPSNGLYNIGTGKAETFLSLANSIFSALNKEVQIEFIDTPLDIRDKYQYFTEADMTKLRVAGYTEPTFTLSDAVTDYVKHYLNGNVGYGS